MNMNKQRLVHIVSGALCALAALTLMPGTAHAVLTGSGTTGNDIMYFGRVTHGTFAHWMCRIDGSGSVNWVQLHTSATLTDDVELNGLGGGDTIHVARGTSYGVDSRCAADAGGIAWRAPLYGSRSVTLNGGDGGDALYQGDSISDVFGGNHDDNAYWFSYLSTRQMRGGAGNDSLYDWASNGSNVFFGEAGDDCLEDTGSATTFDCGEISEVSGDSFLLGSGSAPTCENAVSFCP